MDRALELARRGPVHGPNPRVGCVLLAAADTDADAAAAGRGSMVLAEGWHAGVGTPHAEVAALLAAREAGVDVRGCTAVVTLEPCNHTGRTGPCAQALLDAGVGRVVIAVADPNPIAAGERTTCAPRAWTSSPACARPRAASCCARGCRRWSAAGRSSR